MVIVRKIKALSFMVAALAASSSAYPEIVSKGVTASPADGTGVHILRGGCFANTASGVFFTKRSMERYSNSYAGIGCRLVLPLNLTDATTGN